MLFWPQLSPPWSKLPPSLAWMAAVASCPFYPQPFLTLIINASPCDPDHLVITKSNPTTPCLKLSYGFLVD